MLNEIFQGRRPNQLIFGLPAGMKETEDCVAAKPDIKTQGDFYPLSETRMDLSNQTMSPNPKSDASDSTVLYNMNSTRENHVVKGDCDTGKEDFFSSDLDENVSSLEETDSEKEKIKKRRSKRKCKRKKNELAKGVEEEEKELEKLLRMTEINTNNRTTSPGSEEEKEGKKQKENTKLKPREVSLMDCLEAENVSNSNPDVEKEEDEEENGNDFFSTVNRQVKETFLLSSAESAEQSSEEIENDPESEKEKKKSEKRKKKTKVKPEGDKRRKDDLSEFRVPNLSVGEESSEDGMDAESSGDGSSSKGNEATSEENSNDSVKCVEFVVKGKRESRNCPEQTTDSDSGSDIQQVFCKTEVSPTKGRKNIKKILKKESLQMETKQALKTETERKKRVSERQKLFEKLFPDAGNSSKLVLDFDPQTKEELVVVDENLSRLLKPHQKDGVRFMWNCCFESLKRLEEDSGSGCVLAHCMGLGKSLQVITLVHTIFTHNTGVQTVLIICPLNTIRNWAHEFKTWQRHCAKKIKPVVDLIPCKSQHSRIGKVRTWSREGGVMIISYEMFRSLMNKRNNNFVLVQGFLDPGPDLVVCDEGHVLKNNNSALSKCISQIKTLRRIILTGTPLQNNLAEYYCMVQFVKPNILGTMKEFKNRFVNPINNGQFEDSTQWDVRLMKRRAHVLHAMLEGFVQRFGYYVLTPFLPEKHEYVISIALTDTQEVMYRFFTNRYAVDDPQSRGLLKDFHWLQKVWTHPRALKMHSMKYTGDNLPWQGWTKYVREEDYEDIRSGGKLLILFDILKLSKLAGDKVLLFSQSLLSLDLIEFFLQKGNQEFARGCRSEIADSWVFGKDYFRLDGSTNSETRDLFCKKFNNEEDRRFRLFLVSTKAGGLGISLVAANRVVVFDASWNPTHDVQSIFRVYRFGQKKPCFIYRLLAAATMEEKIYRRQVTKLSLAHRILDEHQIERHYTMGNLQELYTYDPIPRCEWKIPKIPKDKIFADVLPIRRDIIVSYHEHDSLLENKEEEELSEEERRAAWEDFEKEKLTPQDQQQENGDCVPPFMNVVNKEGLKIILAPQRGVVGPGSHQSSTETESQVCKIVNVRTLRSVGSFYGGVGTSRVLELGQSFGMRPLANESPQDYYGRVARLVKRILPWGTPEGMMQGSGNN